MAMQQPENLPFPIMTDGSNEFAYNTMRLRHPQMIQAVLDTNPNFPTETKHQLSELRDGLLENAPIPMLNLYPTPTPDYIDWASAYVERRSMYAPGSYPDWFGVDWLYAETAMYRVIIEAVRWWELERDPYAPIKQRELDNPVLWETLEVALTLNGGVIDRIAELVKLAMWGNRIDLSHAESMERGVNAKDDDLLVDDSEAVKDHLLRAQLEPFPDAQQGVSHIILDNTGTELAMDMALADALLTGFSDVVILHTKYHPTYVSDATSNDVRQMIDRCLSGNHGGETSTAVFAMGQRLQAALNRGRLRLAPNLFWNGPFYLWQMPQILQHVFDGAQLVTLKGDANYRRAVGDAIWEATTPFDEVVSYFHAPLLALRTLKSDPIVGLPAGLEETLNDADSQWRVNGQRGVVQLKV